MKNNLKFVAVPERDKKTILPVIKFCLVLQLILQLTCVNISAQTPEQFSGNTFAVWMWGSTLSKEPADSLLKKLKDNYVSEVYLLVKGTAGTITDSALTAGFIKEAHANKLKIHFWYIIGNDEVFLSTHPDAHIYHCPKPSLGYTSPYPDSGSSVNLLYPGYKDYMLKNITYLLNNFECDGIHLDVIRFPNITFSFDNYSLEKASSLGINTRRLLNLFNENYDYYIPAGGVADGGFVNLYKNGDADITAWVNMRKNIVYDYIKSIKDLIQHSKPGIALTAAFMPEATLDPLTADVYYAQSYSLNSELLDAIMPMAYCQAFNEPASWLKKVTEGAIKQVDPQCKIITGIQTYDEVTPQQVKEQIIFSLEGGASGVVLFRYGTTTEDEWEAVRGILQK